MDYRSPQTPGISGVVGQFTTLEATRLAMIGDITPVQGDIIYYNGSNWVALGYGTDGQLLKTQGIGANPIWVTAGAGDMVLASIQSVTGLKTFDTTKLAIKGSSTGTTAIASANAGATSYTQTLPARDGTIANLDNVTFIGTTSVALNRTSAALTLAGITLTTPDIGTPSAGVLTNATGLPISGLVASTTLAIGVGSIELGHATDTTIARAAAGRITVETVAVARSSSASATDNTLARFDSTTGDLIQTTGIVVDDSNNMSSVGTLGVGAITSSGTLALSANSITMTGSLAATGARVTKGWFTDVESTNMPTVGGTAILTSLTAPQFTTIELGHATQNTLSAASGVLSVEGVVIPSVSSTNTLTNKSLTLSTGNIISLGGIGNADAQFKGITVTGTAGTTIVAGNICYLAVADSKWELTDADALATAGGVLIGVATAAIAENATGEFLLYGLITETTASLDWPALTVGATVYVGETAGTVQVAIPTGANNIIRVLGYATAADEIMFNPSAEWQVTVA